MQLNKETILDIYCPIVIVGASIVVSIFQDLLLSKGIERSISLTVDPWRNAVPDELSPET